MDILCGRGRGAFEHSGNRRMLLIIAPYKQAYQVAPKVEKAKIARHVYELIVNQVDTRVNHRPRFIKKGKASKKDKSEDSSQEKDNTSCWYELSMDEAIKKVAHTLREQKTVVNHAATTTIRHGPENDDSQSRLEANSDDSVSATSSSTFETPTQPKIAYSEDHHHHKGLPPPPPIPAIYPVARYSTSSSVMSSTSVLSASAPSDWFVRPIHDAMECQLENTVDSPGEGVDNHAGGMFASGNVSNQPRDVTAINEEPLPDDILPLELSSYNHSMIDTEDLNSLLDILK